MKINLHIFCVLVLCRLCCAAESRDIERTAKKYGYPEAHLQNLYANYTQRNNYGLNAESLTRNLKRDSFVDCVAVRLDGEEGIKGFVNGLKYRKDPKCEALDPATGCIVYIDIDYVRTPTMTIVDGGGDCEDMAILFAALVSAKGGVAQVVCVDGHAGVVYQMPGEKPRMFDLDGVDFSTESMRVQIDAKGERQTVRIPSSYTN